MYDTTGLSRDEIVELCALIHSAGTGPEDKKWPPSVTRLIRKVLAPYVPTAEDLDERCQYLVDGTLLPCWSWAAHPELYSGKHKTTGMNVQVACTLAEKLAWISDPIEGSRHDSHCLNESGVLLTLDPADWIGDKGYVGNGMITPIKKPEGRGLLDWEKEFNKQVNKIRAMIERVIANFKTWRIMHTDYRRPIDTFATTISAVIALHFCDVYSAETLRSLIEQVYSGALVIYRDLVSSWFPAFVSMLGLACMMPVAIHGQLAPREGMWDPTFVFHMDPLPPDAPQSAEISLVTTREELLDKWWDTVFEQSSRTRQLITALHPGAEGWAHPRSASTLSVYGDMPATAHAYRWLWEDLKEIRVVKQQPPVGEN